jgi:tetratricopeptide (TPR) repeat protein
MTINLTSKKILIANAHGSMRENIKSILWSLGARSFVVTESGVETMAALKKDNFDIVFCDNTLLGNKSGLQVLEDARHLKLLPVNTMFIISTDQHRLELVPNEVDSKPDDYLIKPFSQKQLSSLLAKCDARKRYLSTIENEIESGNLFQAIRNCEKLLQLDNKSMHSELLKIHASLAIRVGDFNTAEMIYLGILQKRDLPWVRLGLGIVAFYRTEYEQAFNAFNELVMLYPGMIEAFDWLAKTHEAMGNDLGALSSVNTAVKLAPTSIKRQKKLASLADKTENIDAAKKAYMATIELTKNSIHRSSSDYAGLANAYLKCNAPDKALDVVVKMNQLFKNDLIAKLRAALLEIRIYQRKDNYKLVQRAYTQISELNALYSNQIPKELHLEIAKIFYMNGKREDCDRIFNDLFQANIDDNFFINEMVTMCDAIIDEDYAKTFIEPLTKELGDIHNKGARLFKENDFKGARDVFEQATTKRPSNHKIILNLIKIIIHEIKTFGADPEKIISAQTHINKAIQLGVPHDQIKPLQTVLDTFKAD